MSSTLYAIPGSHAGRTAELMLQHKGIDYRRVDFVPGTHRMLVRRMMLLAILPLYRVTPGILRADRAIAGDMLDRVDRLIADGVLNGSELNAADFQIVTSLALVDYVVELRPAIRSRPLLGLLDRVLPEPSRQVI